MLKFKYIKVAGMRHRALAPSGAEAVLRAMKKRPTWEGTIISPDAKPGLDGAGQYPILSLDWYSDRGYAVHCMELAPRSHFLSTSTTLSEPVVTIELGGQGQELWPPELFVPDAMALKATRFLLRYGKRDPSLTWVAIDAFRRRKVKPRARRQGAAAVTSKPLPRSA